MLASLEELDALAHAHPSQNPHLPYWMLTLSLGTALTRSALVWGESALEQLTALDAAAPANPQPAESSAAQEKP